MLKRIILLTICIALIFQFILLPLALAQGNNAQRGREGVLGWIDKHRTFAGIIFLFVMGVIARIVSQLKKDRLVKPLVGKYVNIEMREPSKYGGPYKGILRVDMQGIEIISEKARLEGKEGNYFIENCNPNTDINRYVRYHDEMNERELREREQQLEKAYHPGPVALVLRKMRNAYGFMQDAFNSVLRQFYNKYVSQKIRQQEFYKELENIEKESQQYKDEKGRAVQEMKVADVEKRLRDAYIGDFDYNRGLERMVGTKVNSAISKEPSVFVDYTKNFYYFMDVEYESGFEITIENKYNAGMNKDYELRVKRQDDGLLIESNLSYPVQLREIEFGGKKGDVVGKKMEKLHERYQPIEPYGQMYIKFDQWSKPTRVGPFSQVILAQQQPVTWRNAEGGWQKVKFSFKRKADIVANRLVEANKIKSRHEQYQPTRMKLSAMTENLLLEEKPEEILIVDENNKPIPGIHSYHGYITNVDQDKMDPREIDLHYSHRWSVEHGFNILEKELRPLKAPHIVTPGVKRKRMLSQTALVEKLKSDKLIRDSISQVLYTPIMRNGRLNKKAPIVLPIKVLALMGNMSRVEFPVLRKFNNIRGHKIIYEQTKDVTLPHIEHAHILWIGQGEIFRDGYQFRIDTESRIKNFVSKGGIVITSGQYLTIKTRRRYASGWVPEKLIGVDRQETKEFDPTIAAGDLFKKPHQIEPGGVVIGDAWTEWTNNFTVLATANGGGDAAALSLMYGDGIYLITSFRNESEEDVRTNAKMMENLLYYSVEWLEEQHSPELLVA